MIDIKIDQFQGPLSLLLRIIEREEMDITSLSLVKIADEYLEYVRNTDNISPDRMSDFLLMATKLLYIKSRALLPCLFNEEDEIEAEDLERQLRIYKEFISFSEKIEKMIGKKRFSFSRVNTRSNRRTSILGECFFPPKNVETEDLRKAFLKLEERVLVQEERLEEDIVRHEISIEDKISFIKKLIKKKIKFNFSNILKESKSKTEVIVNFLAVLELSKQRSLIVEQVELFSDIFVKSQNENTN